MLFLKASTAKAPARSLNLFVSQQHMLPNGPIDEPLQFTASTPVPIGRPGEGRVNSVVRALVATSERSLSSQPARDAHGEDGVLLVNGTPYTIQATGIPQAPDFWRRVTKEGSATTSATLEQMSGWLEAGIAAKLSVTPPSDRAQTILALDCDGWADAIVTPSVVESLSSCGLNPAMRHGLAGIAIVGAGTSNSTWLPGQLT